MDTFALSTFGVWRLIQGRSQILEFGIGLKIAQRSYDFNLMDVLKVSQVGTNLDVCVVGKPCYEVRPQLLDFLKLKPSNWRPELSSKCIRPQLFFHETVCALSFYLRCFKLFFSSFKERVR